MDASLAGLVRAGKLTLATAESRSSHPTELRRLVQGEAPAPTAVAA
jgi:twitching motility protein PilT